MASERSITRCCSASSARCASSVMRAKGISHGNSSTGNPTASASATTVGGTSLKNCGTASASAARPRSSSERTNRRCPSTSRGQA